MAKDRTYICYFDCNGFEVLCDITDYENRLLLNMIAGETLHKPPFDLQAMMLRARFNPQRDPEIWFFTSELDEKMLWKYAKEEPQALADAVRRCGKPADPGYKKNTPKAIV